MSMLYSGWVPLGKTSGYGRKAGVYYYHGESKTIFVKPLHKDAHKILSASFLPPEYEGGEKGTKSFIGIGEWAANLSQEMLKRLGCKYSDRLLEIYSAKWTHFTPNHPILECWRGWPDSGWLACRSEYWQHYRCGRKGFTWIKGKGTHLLVLVEFLTS